MYWVDILNGPSRGRRRIQRRSTLVGSALTCQLWLEGDGIATRHVELIDRGGDVMVRPLGSARVMVNGQPIGEAKLLSDGDTIAIGSVRLRYRARLSVVERWGPALRVVVPLLLSLLAAAWVTWQWLMQRVDIPPAEVISPLAPYTPPDDAPTVEPGTLAKMDQLGAAAIAATESPAEPLPPAAVEPPMEPTPASPPAPVSAPEPAATRATPAAIPPSLSTSTSALAAVDAPSSSSPPGSQVAAAAPPPPVSPPGERSTPTSSEPSAVVSPLAAVALAPAPSPSRPPVSPHAAAIDAAESLIRGGDVTAAVQRVAAVPASDPLFPRVQAIRARAAEAEGRLRDAERLWTDILKQSSGTPLYEAAFQELIRLAEIQVAKAPPPLLDMARSITAAPPTRAKPPELPKPIVSPAPPKVAAPPAATSAPPAQTAGPAPPPSPPPSAPRPAPATAASPAPTGTAATAATPPSLGAAATTAPPLEIRRPSPPAPTATFVRANVTRFPSDASHDDLRVLTVEIRLDGAAGVFSPERLTFDVAFFDRFGDNLTVVPSRVAFGAGRFRAGGGMWRVGETRSLSFPYTVPRGAREAEQKRYGAAGTYHGFRIRMFADGKPIGAHAKPSDLLALP